MSGSDTPAPAPLAPQTNTPVSATGTVPTPQATPADTPTAPVAPTEAVDPFAGHRPQISSRPFPAPAEFESTPIYMGTVPKQGDDDGYDSLTDDPADDTASPAEYVDTLVVASESEPFGVYMVNRRGNADGLTVIYGDGSPLAIERLILRQGALSVLRQVQAIMTEANPERRLLILTGVVPAYETATVFKLSFQQACANLGIDPNTNVVDEILDAGRTARKVNTPASVIDTDGSELQLYLTNLGRGSGSLNANAITTKGAGGSVNTWLTDKKGNPLFMGCYYDDPNAGAIAEMDFFERANAFTQFVIGVRSTKSMALCAIECGYDPEKTDSLAAAFEVARMNRRLLFWSMLSYDAYPYYGLVSFWDLPVGNGNREGSYCRSAMRGLTTARWTCRGAAKQLEVLGT